MSGRLLLVLALLVMIGCQTLSSVGGSWTGTIASPEPVGVRFDLAEENGSLSGRIYFEDDLTHEFLPEAAITGSRDGAEGSWTTETNVRIVGKFQGNRFLGTITFPASGIRPARSAELTLSR